MFIHVHEFEISSLVMATMSSRFICVSVSRLFIGRRIDCSFGVSGAAFAEISTTHNNRRNFNFLLLFTVSSVSQVWLATSLLVANHQTFDLLLYCYSKGQCNENCSQALSSDQFGFEATVLLLRRIVVIRIGTISFHIPCCLTTTVT